MPTLSEYIQEIKNNNQSLASINIYNANLSDADLQPLTQALKDNPNMGQQITLIKLDQNQLTKIDVLALLNIKTLDLARNHITKIELSTSTKLERLCIHSNKLETIDLSNQTNLKELCIEENNIGILDISNLKNIMFIYIGGNKLTEVTKIILKEYESSNNNCTFYYDYVRTRMKMLTLPSITKDLLIKHFNRFEEDLKLTPVPEKIKYIALFFKTKNIFELDLMVNMMQWVDNSPLTWLYNHLNYIKKSQSQDSVVNQFENYDEFNNYTKNCARAMYLTIRNFFKQIDNSALKDKAEALNNTATNLESKKHSL